MVEPMNKFKSIVFIDDDFACNIFHEIVVKQSGCCNDYQFFISSTKALEYFKGLSEKQDPKLPELIFLDLNMPRMNGWAFMDALEQLNFSNPPKVIILSTSSYKKDIEKAEEYPLVHKYICKPLESSHIQSLRDELILEYNEK